MQSFCMVRRGFSTKERTKITEAEQYDLAQLFGRADHPRPLQETAAAFLLARQKKEEAEIALKMANMQLAQIEGELIAALGAREQSSVPIGERMLTLAKSVHFSVPVHVVEERFFQTWLLRMGGHDLLRRTLDQRGFSHLCRDLAAKSVALHPEIRKFERTAVQVRGK